jgi:hypothetical protein
VQIKVGLFQLVLQVRLSIYLALAAAAEHHMPVVVEVMQLGFMQ